MRMRVLVLAAAVLAFGLGVRSASADPILFYLVPSGPTTVPTAVLVGTTTYQLWIDPSGVYAPALYGPSCLFPINCGCTGISGFHDLAILGDGSLTLTAFTPNTNSPVLTSGGLSIICVGTICADLPPSVLAQLPKALVITSTGGIHWGRSGTRQPWKLGAYQSSILVVALANPPAGVPTGFPYYNDANELNDFPRELRRDVAPHQEQCDEANTWLPPYVPGPSWLPFPWAFSHELNRPVNSSG